MCHAKLGEMAEAKNSFDRAVKAWEAKKGLPADHPDAAKVKDFRDEAAAVLGVK